ncbi:hypothetical protein GCM10023196_022350 [Actinoallomurus vinaceus]|uniref:Uncharacterized protein n=1 Tax=Actinoallomurus vinaceus TaxID=1080074 RepID=A0ABP8U721_9ACTN
MIQRGTLEVSPDKNIALRLGAYATITVIIGMVWIPASAYAARMPGRGPATLVTDHTDSGNGHHNRASLSVRSPVHNHGYQHTNNGNSGGLNPVQNAMCAHATVCNVTQKFTVVRPEKPARPASRRTEPLVRQPEAPAQQAATPVQTLDIPARGADAPTPTNPFLYIGPYGIMLMPGSSGWSGSGAAGGPEPLECLRTMFP